MFLAGETRGQPQNTAMRKALFQYLHEQQGVNVQLVETGVGETQVLEQYLRTGDENWLNHYLSCRAAVRMRKPNTGAGCTSITASRAALSMWQGWAPSAIP